jgi:TonB-linked SusC/RagA family outer membrane protein
MKKTITHYKPKIALMKRNIFYILPLVFSMCWLHVQAQDLTIQGVVIGKDSQDSLQGVTVALVRDAAGKRLTGRTTTTNRRGHFRLSAPTGATIRVSFVGYEPYTFKATPENQNRTILLTESKNELEEIVLNYTRQKPQDNTAAITVIEASTLVATPAANVMELLQGRVAGLNIQLNNGTPGMQGTYTIRGISDIGVTSSGEDVFLNSSNPLFVVDGIPQQDVGEFNSQGLLDGSGISPISMVAVEDIENIVVLKDAQATAQYGSRGAYGVIIINTKRGNSPTPKIDYNGRTTVNTPPRLRDVMVGMTERNSRIYQLLSHDTSRYHGYYDIHANPILSDSLNAYYNNNTDWQNIFMRTTYNHDHNLRFSGGDPSFNYKVNGNYYQERGIIRKTGFERYGISMLMEYKPFEKFKIMAQASTNLGLSNKGSGNALGQSGVANGANASSLLPPPSLYTTTNDVLRALSVENQSTALGYSANIQTTYRLPYDIDWNSTFAYTYSTDDGEIFTPGILIGNRARSGSSLSSYSSNSSNIYIKSSVGYSRKVSIFNLGLILGGELDMNSSTGNSINLGGLPNGIFGPVGQDASVSNGFSTLSTRNNTVAIIISPSFGIGGLSKSFSPGAGDKYVFNPSIRPELNSAYGSKMKITINPSFGFRWNFRQEPFMENMDFLNYGAIRTSWGRVVKYRASIYDVWGAYLLNGEGNTYNGEAYTPVDFNNMPNPDLKPVASTSWNLGLEMAMFDRMISFTGDAYYRQVDNQLSDIDLADHNSFNSVRSTDVSLVNYGLELALGVTPFKQSKDFSMTANFILAINRDVITKLPNDVRQIISNNTQVVNKLGGNALSHYLYVNKGVYAYDEDVPADPATGRRLRVGGSNSESELAYFRAGDPIFVDLNGDYIIDERDLSIVGNSQPRMTGGINMNIRYKALSVNMNTSFTLRRDIINASLSQRFGYFNSPTATNASNNGVLVPIGAYNFWAPDNRQAEYPNPYDYTRVNMMTPFRPNQTLFMEDGSYFKINGISVAYALGRNLLDSLGGIERVSLTASANNIYTFSRYSGVNPENVSDLGYDNSSGYPNSRTYSVGLNVSF